MTKGSVWGGGGGEGEGGAHVSRVCVCVGGGAGMSSDRQRLTNFFRSLFRRLKQV